MDYGIFYKKISKPFRRYSKIVRLLNKILTYVFYILYPVLLLISIHSDNLWKIIIFPGISFILLSLIRKHINKPRPYEQWKIKPIIHKNTKGNSMPSRHVFSSVIISMCYVMIYPVIGVILLILSLLAAIIRVIGGVHYPVDVIAGYAIGIVAGIIMIII